MPSLFQVFKSFFKMLTLFYNAQGKVKAKRFVPTLSDILELYSSRSCLHLFKKRKTCMPTIWFSCVFYPLNNCGRQCENINKVHYVKYCVI